MNATELVPVEAIGQKIFIIRGVKVMLDADLAELYGVTTGNLNLAVQRNLSRFPKDFMFQLTSAEYESLILQFARPKVGRGGRRNSPYCFSEHGVAMLSSVLKSKRAIDMNIFIIRAFIKLREFLATNEDLAQRVDILEREQMDQGKHIREIDDVVRQLIDEPIQPKEKLGFRRD